MTSEWLVGGGEMGKLIRSMDWTNTSLGPIEDWPQSLRTTVGLCLSSTFPIALVWGPQHNQLYNDGYWPICGAKHPHSMGQDFSECWASAFPVIGDAFRSALSGTAGFLEDQRMFLDRLGYLEETFFTFSFSPIRDESGQVAGLFHPVTETTGKMLTHRRTRILRDVAQCGGKSHTLEDSLSLMAQTLSESSLDVPFALFYKIDSDHRRARLVAQTGLAPGSAACPLLHDLATGSSGWPMAEACEGSSTYYVDDVGVRFPKLACAPYPEYIRSACLLPVRSPGATQTTCLVVVGASVRLPMSDTYRAFFDLLGSTLSTVGASAIALEEERERAEALAEIDRAKTAFFSNVSHEFRTPLALILGPLEDELAERRNALPAARRDRLQLAHRNSLRLLKLVNALLDFSRIEAGRLRAAFEPTDLTRLTAELASNFRSACERAGLALVVECVPLPEAVFVDREMWERIVLNLLSNAFKFTLQGSIHVALRASGNVASLTVSDTGSGIPPDAVPRLFERFYRVEGARGRTQEGSGIGLALTRELVLLHGGDIRVESVLGEGTSFEVTIPLGCAHLPASQVGAGRSTVSTGLGATPYVNEAMGWLRPADTTGAPVAGAEDDSRRRPAVRSEYEAAIAVDPRAAGKRARILWADDNTDMRNYVRNLLSDQFDVEAVCNGVEALAAANREPPELVLCDIMMPEMDGLTLLRELRLNERTRTVPVILLSARAGEESRVDGLASGADDYLVKPFSARELVARVDGAVRLARIRHEAEQKLADAAAELRRSNRELETFAYAVAHDLRAPLRHMNGYASILKDEFKAELPEEAADYIDRIFQATGRMSDVIQGLLTLSRLSYEPLHKESVDLSAVAERSRRDLEANESSRKCHWWIEPGIAVEGDPRLLEIVVRNLLENAWKYSARTNEVEIRFYADRSEQQPKLCVSDNGAGFDMSHAARLFQPFQRLHRQDEFAGLGIGLATVQRIAQRHGGHVSAWSAPGKGATFLVALPGLVCNAIDKTESARFA